MGKICGRCGQPKTHRCSTCEAATLRARRAADPEKYRAAERARHAANRERVLDRYGRACACCGGAYKLTVDHVGGDGKVHRAAIGGGSVKLYAWLIRNKFPAGFQVLCLACNLSKNDGVRCRIDHSTQWEGVREAFLSAPQDQQEAFRAWLSQAALPGCAAPRAGLTSCAPAAGPSAGSTRPGG